MLNSEELGVLACIKNLCAIICLNYDKVISDKLTIDDEGICCIDGAQYDDRTDLIMSMRLFLTNYFPNVEFRRQVYEYYNKEVK